MIRSRNASRLAKAGLAVFIGAVERTHVGAATRETLLADADTVPVLIGAGEDARLGVLPESGDDESSGDADADNCRAEPALDVAFGEEVAKSGWDDRIEGYGRE